MKIPISQARKLAATGKKVETYRTAVCKSTGMTGRVCDAIYDLPDGRQLELACDFGWLYQGFVWTREEVEKASRHCPYHIQRETGL